MLWLNHGLFLRLKVCHFSASVDFCHTVIVLLLAHSCQGQSQGVGSSQTIVAVVGEDVILPCHLDPALDAVSKSVEWGRPDLEPRFVHVWHEGQDLLVNQNPSYKGRTSVFIEKLKHGDLSLTLSAVKHSDNGRYRCYFPSLDKESTVELVVGSVSSPVMAKVYLNSSEVVVECKSEGWYPEPEVLWLDGEGNLLSAGPPETVRGPDDLYTVSSRVTVEKRHSNRFTCRVQQKNINQTRETHIQLSADCFEVTSSSSSSAARVSVLVVILLLFILAAAFGVWKWRQNQTKDTKMHHEDESEEREQLTAERKKMQDLEEKRAKLEEMLQKKEEEQKDLEKVVNLLMEQKEELNNQTDQLEQQKTKMEKNMEEIDNKMKSVEKKAESDKAQGYCDMKEITLEAKNHLTDRKQEDQTLHMKIRTLLNKLNTLLNTMTDWKKAAENQKKEIREQLEEIHKKLQSEQKQETLPV